MSSAPILSRKTFPTTHCIVRSNAPPARILISREKQSVHIAALGRTFEFDQWEPIFMEISQKYTFAMIDDLAAASGFSIETTFLDEENFYCDSLWRPM